ncbi:MAG: helix-turn-helix domain-containing protein [Clostridia bacterium]|nr:helix-turn-helix domain-containing protein [Clostridia bacterium]MBQ9355001.1 helix-turn-helix domain-containing protein [Clostridia bacterium]MDY6367733.1 helix-turn-helix domain-containing protein [Clostridia bacterium]
MNDNQEMFANYPDVLTLENLMEMLQIGKVFAYKLVKDKKVKAIKIGREYKITKESVIKLFNEGVN